MKVKGFFFFFVFLLCTISLAGIVNEKEINLLCMLVERMLDFFCSTNM